MVEASYTHRESSFSPLISVVVCTYNRAKLLAGVLKTLCEQGLGASDYEVIVVDNNSNDDTPMTVERFCSQYANIQYYFEPHQGLSQARNLGWQEANGEYVAYIDDDCLASRRWLEVAKDIITARTPLAFGGPYFAYSNSPKPRWFKDSYGSHVQGTTARWLSENEYLDGGNFFVRRELLESLGGFDINFGMSGGRIGYGEETALLRKIRTTRQGELIYYDPRLYVHHLVAARKMNLRWIMRQRFITGRDCHRVFEGDECRAVGRSGLVKRLSMILVSLTIDLMRGVLKRDRDQYPYIQNYLYEHSFIYVLKLGMLYEQYRQSLQRQILRQERKAI